MGRVQNSSEDVLRNVRHELQGTKVMIVAHVTVETACISNKILPLLLTGSGLTSMALQCKEILRFKVELEECENDWRLVGDLEWNHFSTSPGCLGHKVSIVLFFF